MKRMVLCAALMAFSTMASAVVYKWVDAQGKVQYGDRPPDGVHAEVVEMMGPHPTSRANPPVTSARPVSPVTPGNSADDTAKKAVAADVEAVREKQCTDAQDRYRKLIDGRRLYRVGSDGEREYLTSEQIDAERLEAKRDVDSLCDAQG